jgi:hypothetical protein
MLAFLAHPTRLSIGDWNPCADGLSARSGDGDTARDTEKSNRQLPVLNRLRWRMQCALSLKHHEQSASEYGVCGNTVFDTVSDSDRPGIAVVHLMPDGGRTRTMPGALSLPKFMNEINESAKSRW